jgi:hypothetical protein
VRKPLSAHLSTTLHSDFVLSKPLSAPLSEHLSSAMPLELLLSEPQST